MSEKLIDKVRKLLALSESDNENEAKLAMLKAQEIMVAHNIAHSDLKINESKDVNEEVFGEKTKKKWRYKLASIVAENFKCEVFYRGDGRRGNRVVFVGFQDDIDVTKVVYESAVNVIEKNQNRVYKLARKNGYESKGIKNSYAKGFLFGLMNAFESQKERMGMEWGLVLQVPVEVKNHMTKKTFDGDGISMDIVAVNDFALHEGYDDGKKFSVHEQIETEV